MGTHGAILAEQGRLPEVTSGPEARVFCPSVAAGGPR